jgi:hypothetical protein
MTPEASDQLFDVLDVGLGLLDKFVVHFDVNRAGQFAGNDLDLVGRPSKLCANGSFDPGEHVRAEAPNPDMPQGLSEASWRGCASFNPDQAIFVVADEVLKRPSADDPQNAACASVRECPPTERASALAPCVTDRRALARSAQLLKQWPDAAVAELRWAVGNFPARVSAAVSLGEAL